MRQFIDYLMTSLENPLIMTIVIISLGALVVTNIMKQKKMRSRDLPKLGKRLIAYRRLVVGDFLMYVLYLLLIVMSVDMYINSNSTLALILILIWSINMVQVASSSRHQDCIYEYGYSYRGIIYLFDSKIEYLWIPNGSNYIFQMRNGMSFVDFKVTGEDRKVIEPLIAQYSLQPEGDRYE